MRAQSLIAGVLIFLVATSIVAQATEDARPERGEIFARGLEYFEKGDWGRALIQFNDPYVRSESSDADELRFYRILTEYLLVSRARMPRNLSLPRRSSKSPPGSAGVERRVLSRSPQPRPVPIRRDPARLSRSKKALQELLNQGDSWSAHATGVLLDLGQHRRLVEVEHVDRAVETWANEQDRSVKQSASLQLFRSLLQFGDSERWPNRRWLESLWNTYTGTGVADTTQRRVLLEGLNRERPSPSRSSQFFLAEQVESRLGGAEDALHRVRVYQVLSNKFIQGGRGQEFYEYQERAALAVPPDSTWGEYSQRDQQYFRQMLRSARDFRTPGLQVQGPGVHAPGTDHCLLLRWWRAAELSVEVIAISPEARLPRPESVSDSSEGFPKFWLENFNDGVVWSWKSEPIPPGAVSTVTGMAIPDGRGEQSITIPARSVGYYLVRARAKSIQTTGTPVFPVPPDAVQYHLILVTDAAMMSHLTAEGTDAVLVDSSTGRPFADTPFEVVFLQSVGDSIKAAHPEWSYMEDYERLKEFPAELIHRKKWSSVHGRTDDRGHLFIEPPKAGWSMDVIRVDRPDHFATMVPAAAPRVDYSGPGSLGYFFFDRPGYSASDSVKAFVFPRVRRSTEANPRLVRADSFATALPGNRGRMRWHPVDDTRRFDLRVGPEHGAEPGTSLGVHFKGEDLRRFTHQLFEHGSNEVRDFEVSLERASTRPLILGDELVVRATAKDLVGTPIEGTVMWRVSRRPTEVRYRSWLQAPWAHDPLDTRPAWTGEWAKVHAEFDTLASGQCELRLSSTDAPKDRDWTYRVEAEARRHGGYDRTQELNVLATRARVSAEFERRWITVLPTTTSSMRFRVVDQQGQSSGASLKLRLLRREEGPGPSLVREFDVDVDSTGIGTLKQKIDEPGNYIAELLIDTATGETRLDRASILCTDRAHAPRFVTDEALVAIPSQLEYAQGETARIALQSSFSEASVLATVRTRAGSVAHVVRLRDGVGVLEVELSGEHVPSFVFEAALVGGQLVQWTQTRVGVLPLRHFLEVDVSFAGSVYEPGQSATLDVEVRNGYGDPVRVPLAITVFDDGLGMGDTSQWPDPREVLYPNGVAARRSPATSAGFGRRSPIIGPGTVETEAPEDRRIPCYQMGGSAFIGRGDRGLGGKPLVESFDSVSAGHSTPTSLKSGTEVDAEAATNLHSEASGRRSRADHRAIVVWSGEVETDEQGKARIEAPLSEDITRWRAMVLALDEESRTGLGTTTTRTSKPVVVRLEGPAFVRTEDQPLWSAWLVNTSEEAVSSTLRLALPAVDHQVTTEVMANGKADAMAELDFGAMMGELVSGEDATPTLAVRLDAPQDAVEHELWMVRNQTPWYRIHRPVLVDGNGRLVLRIPEARIPDATKMSVRLGFLPSGLALEPDLPCARRDFYRRYFEASTEGARHALARLRVLQAMDADTLNAHEIARRRLDQVLECQLDNGGWPLIDAGVNGSVRVGTRIDVSATVDALVYLDRARNAGFEVEDEVFRSGAESLLEGVGEVAGDAIQVSKAFWGLRVAVRALGFPKELEHRLFKMQSSLSAELRSENPLAVAYSTLAAAQRERAQTPRGRTLEVLLRGIEFDPRGELQIGAMTEPGSRWGQYSLLRMATVAECLATWKLKPDLRSAIVRWVADAIADGSYHCGHQRPALSALALELVAEVAQTGGGAAPRLVVDGQPLVLEAVPDEPFAWATASVELERLLAGSSTARVEIESDRGPLWVDLSLEGRSHGFVMAEPTGRVLLERQIFRLVKPGSVEQIQVLREGDELERGDRVRIVHRVRGLGLPRDAVLRLPVAAGLRYLIPERVNTTAWDHVRLAPGIPPHELSYDVPMGGMRPIDNEFTADFEVVHAGIYSLPPSELRSDQDPLIRAASGWDWIVVRGEESGR